MIPYPQYVRFPLLPVQDTPTPLNWYLYANQEKSPEVLLLIKNNPIMESFTPRPCEQYLNGFLKKQIYLIILYNYVGSAKTRNGMERNQLGPAPIL